MNGKGNDEVEGRKDATVEEIIRLGDRWATAEMQKDGETLREILADDFHFTSTSGRLVSKSEWLGRLPALIIRRFDRSEIKVRLFGDSAILSGVVNLDSQFEERPVKGIFRYADVFVFLSGRWRAVYSHLTLVR